MIAVTAFFIGATLLWLCLDRSPPHWDDAWYLANSLILYDALVDRGVRGYASEFLSMLGSKAPLITALPTPFYLALGRIFRAAYGINLVSMAVLFTIVHLLGRRFSSRRAGLVAVCIAGTMPLLYGLSHWFLVEYSLAAGVAAAVLLLVELDEGREIKFAILFGIVCGLGLLLKISFALFVFPAFAVVFWRQRRPILLLAAGLPCILLAGPWYLFHLRRALETAVAAGWGERAAVYGTGAIFSVRAIAVYLARVLREGVSFYYFGVSVIVLVMLALHRRLRVRAAHASILIAWLLPLLVFMFGANKDVRFIAPILPAFAVALGCGLDLTFPRTKVANSALVLLLAWPVLDLLRISFGWPFHSTPLGYARAYNRTRWVHEAILETVCCQKPCTVGEKRSVVIASDRATFNANNFELAALAARLPVSVATTAYEKDLQAALRLVDGAHLIVVEEGGEPDSAFFNHHRTEVVRHLRTNPRFTELPFSGVLPDGGFVRMFRNSFAATNFSAGSFIPAGLHPVPDLSVGFGGVVSLDAASSTTTADWVEVQYRWRCLRPIPRDYWCFTHVLDAENRVVGFLDHRILNGDPPMTAWRPGDVALEALRLSVSSLSGRPVRLRLGVYHVPTGERLRVAPIANKAGEHVSVTDQNTALLFDISKADRRLLP